MSGRLKSILANRKVVISAALVAVVALLSIFVVGWSRKQPQTTPGALDVEVVLVEQKDVSVYSE